MSGDRIGAQTPPPGGTPWETESQLPRVGDIVAGRFAIIRLLGRGGMGGVYVAQDKARRAQVALKVMLPHIALSPEHAGRFAREAAVAQALTTPHAARVLEFGHAPNGAPFIVMELLSGRDLSEVLKDRGKIPVAEAVGYILQACHALAEAHARGFVHRDLKPANLFIADVEGVAGARVVKVLDFGIAKRTGLEASDDEAEGLTATESTLGSPQYMAPEQIQSAKYVDTRCDIWSLGMILQRAVTGRPAFEASSVGDQMVAVLSRAPTPLRAADPTLPEELERVVFRCLQKRPSARFQNVGQLALALAPFVVGHDGGASKGPPNPPDTAGYGGAQGYAGVHERGGVQGYVGQGWRELVDAIVAIVGPSARASLPELDPVDVAAATAARAALAAQGRDGADEATRPFFAADDAGSATTIATPPRGGVGAAPAVTPTDGHRDLVSAPRELPDATITSFAAGAPRRLHPILSNGLVRVALAAAAVTCLVVAWFAEASSHEGEQPADVTSPKVVATTAASAAVTAALAVTAVTAGPTAAPPPLATTPPGDAGLLLEAPPPSKTRPTPALRATEAPRPIPARRPPVRFERSL